MHQGRTIPAEFIGFTQSQCDKDAPEEVVTSHHELMSNFFAQPDALALGKNMAECEAEGIAPELREHKLFVGNKPSMSMLL